MNDLHNSKKAIITFLNRFHLVIFVVVIVFILSIAILLLNGIVNTASGVDSTPQNTTSTKFDQETIDRIKQLKTSDQPSTPLDFSQGRINPFSE